MADKTQDLRIRNQESATLSGQALLFVFFLLLVVGILTGALAVMWQAEIRTRALEKDGLIAFYLAQAGIERAKIEARNGAIIPGGSSAQTLGAGRYYYYIEDTGGNQRLLRSIGQWLDASGNPSAERQITVRVSGMGTPLPGDDAQVSWSWREI
ncbi:MAG: hypothetical protein A3J51_00450 [Omnitrophica WOR_2 bacterium RIFCSPHIGHO2_02_FULL_45_21]|nr:MAG: hypothetical protein A3J51_00450 [Omnitrophica WOR_2 bacterium RIFCSPHIGHO2_02_FULL_45_21]